jgi:hypothetical protein
MILKMFKYIGLFRSFNSKHNNFVLFYTSDPIKHQKIINESYKNLFDEASPVYLSLDSNAIRYSTKKFENYKEIHAKMFKYLSKVNGEKTKNNYRNRIHYWPSVILTNETLQNFDIILENIAKE